MEEQKYIIKWDDSLDVGISWIDNQHKKLLEKINDLLNATTQTKGKYEIGSVIKFLERYISVHFGLEDKYMLKYNYSKYKDHVDKHKTFIAEFKKIKEEYQQLGISDTLALKITKELWEWYKIHIANIDKAFGVFLKENKISDDELQIAAWTEEVINLMEVFPAFESAKNRQKIISECRELLTKLENHVLLHS